MRQGAGRCRESFCLNCYCWSALLLRLRMRRPAGSGPTRKNCSRSLKGLVLRGSTRADCEAEALRQELASSDGAVWNRRATTAFLHLASDLHNGHLRDRRRLAWRIGGPILDDKEASALLAAAQATHRIRETLAALLPQHRQYKLLKAALAATPAGEQVPIRQCARPAGS